MTMRALARADSRLLLVLHLPAPVSAILPQAVSALQRLMVTRPYLSFTLPCVETYNNQTENADILRAS